MTETIDEQKNANEDLICPITFELFRDPVIAKDGHVYEREAITRWILQHGTSPFTRETLNINDLISDQRLKDLAEKKRKSSVSYHTNDQTVTLPPLRRIPRSRVASEINNPPGINRQLRDGSNKVILSIIISSFIFPVSLILGIVLGLKNSYSQEIDITSNYSGILPTNSSSFSRSGNISQDYYFYETIDVIISNYAFYGFEISGQNSVSMDADLYLNNFNDTNLFNNLINYNYKDKGYSKTLLGTWLQPDHYILMVTTYLCCVTGTFSVAVTGTANVILR